MGPLEIIACRIEVNSNREITTEISFEGELPRDVAVAALNEGINALAVTQRRLLGTGDPIVQELTVS